MITRYKTIRVTPDGSGYGNDLVGLNSQLADRLNSEHRDGWRLVTILSAPHQRQDSALEYGVLLEFTQTANLDQKQTG